MKILSNQTKEGLKMVGGIFWILSCVATFVILIATALNSMGMTSVLNDIHPMVAYVAVPSIIYFIFDGLKRLIRVIHY